jgi:hypothetical protein
MPRRLSNIEHEGAARGAVVDWCDGQGGSGVLLGLTHEAAWRKIMKRLSLAGRDGILTTSAEDPELGGLMHLLWWDPSVRAVLVEDETELDQVRRAIELTGSDALLLVDASTPARLRRLEQEARSADLVVAALGCGESRVPASLVTWSPRLAPALALLDGLQPLSYDALARLHAALP